MFLVTSHGTLQLHASTTVVSHSGIDSYSSFVLEFLAFVNSKLISSNGRKQWAIEHSKYHSILSLSQRTLTEQIKRLLTILVSAHVK